MRQHCTRCEWVCPGAWLDVCATMFRADRGLRPGLALDCHRQPRQWPLRPLLTGAITGHLWQPCHGNEGANWQTRHYTTAWWFIIDILIRRTSQLYDRDWEKFLQNSCVCAVILFSHDNFASRDRPWLEIAIIAWQRLWSPLCHALLYWDIFPRVHDRKVLNLENFFFLH